MKAIVCEMCGSQEFAKMDGMYVCQHCGTKYDPEEAKKLMVEISGSVDVSGSTVSVDYSSFIMKSLENARRAKSKEDWEECEKYYNMVEQHDPRNIEAIFYSSYGKARMAMVESDRFKREQKINVLKNSISIIDDNYDPSPDRYEDQKKLILQINADLMTLVNGNFVYTSTTSNGITTNDRNYTYDMFSQLCLAWVVSLRNIIKVIPDREKTVYLYKLIRVNYLFVYNHVSGNKLKAYRDAISSIDLEIKSIYPHYQPEKIPYRESSGCYVATAVYGSYDCPQVWTLRRYRDNTLAKTWYGRAFIKTYYAISPTLVKWFGHTNWFRNMWKPSLDKMVRKLNDKGVKNTPYNDRKW